MKKLYNARLATRSYVFGGQESQELVFLFLTSQLAAFIRLNSCYYQFQLD